MTTIERCPHPHAWPAIECTGVKLTRARRTPVCMCAHPKAVHEYARAGRTDCGMCDCRAYETTRSYTAIAVWTVILVGCAGFWAAVIGGIAWPLIEAIRNR